MRKCPKVEEKAKATLDGYHRLWLENPSTFFRLFLRADPDFRKNFTTALYA